MKPSLRPILLLVGSCLLFISLRMAWSEAPIIGELIIGEISAMTSRVSSTLLVGAFLCGIASFRYPAAGLPGSLMAILALGIVLGQGISFATDAIDLAELEGINPREAIHARSGILLALTGVVCLIIASLLPLTRSRPVS